MNLALALFSSSLANLSLKICAVVALGTCIFCIFCTDAPYKKHLILKLSRSVGHQQRDGCWTLGTVEYHKIEPTTP